MSLPVFQSTIVTSVGDIIPSPVITVLVEATGDEASLFSDRNGSTVLGTDGVFSGTVDGFAQFYTAPDVYRVTASDAGSGFSQTWRYVVLSGTAATSNIQASATDSTAGALLNKETTSIGGHINWTKGVFQPLDYALIGHTLLARNVSGGNVPVNTDLDGSLLRSSKFTSTGSLTAVDLLTSGHTYKNMSWYAEDDEWSIFVRII